MDPKVRELLRIAARTMESLGVRYAIGGALAMRAYGYRRHTDDVDLFALESDRIAVLRALREAGLEVEPVFSPHHYIATVPGETSRDRRIDVMFPSAEPDLSAVEAPEEDASIDGVPAHVWPIELIVIAKFYSDRPQDEADIAALLDRGLFHPKEVVALIEILDPGASADFLALLQRLSTRPTKRAKPRRKR